MKTQKWLVLEEKGWQVVIPDFDIRPHAKVKISKGKMKLAWMDCPCKPKVSVLDKIIIHNSYMDKQKIDESMIVNLYENPAEMDLI